MPQATTERPRTTAPGAMPIVRFPARRFSHAARRPTLSVLFILVWLLPLEAIGWSAASRSGDLGAGPWFWQNPTPAPSLLNAIDFLDEQRGLAVGSFGTILRTNDGGTTWVPQPESPEEFPDALRTARLIDVSLVDPNTAFLIGEHLIARMDDGGATWTIQDTGSQEHLLADAVFTDAQHGVLVGATGNPKAGGAPLILRTTDGGNTWSEMPNPLSSNMGSLTSVVHIEGGSMAAIGRVIWDIDPVAIRDVFLYTTDGGVSWGAQLFDPDEGDLNDGFSAITFVNSSVGMIVGQGGTILRTTDGGVTWTRQTLDMESISLQGISCADALTCVTVGTRFKFGNEREAVLLRTTDGGAIWTSIPVPAEQSQLARVVFAGSATYFAVGNLAIFRSADAGLTWVDQAYDAIHEEIATPEERIDGRRFLWGFNDVTFISASIALAVGGSSPGSELDKCEDGHGAILRSEDGGSTWHDVTPGPTRLPHSVRAVAFADTQVGVAVGCFGIMLRTTDGGNSWLPVNSGTPLDLHAVHFIDPDTGIAVGGAPCQADREEHGPVILMTDDAGSTWSTQTLPDGVGGCRTLYGVDFATPDIGFVIGRDSELLRTSNGGSTWELLTGDIASDRDFYSISFSDATTGMATGGKDQNDDRTAVIFRTLDGGSSWDNVTPDFLTSTRGSLRHVVALDSLTWVAVGALEEFAHYGVGVVVRTTDGGENWSLVDVPSPNGNSGFASADFAGTHGILVGDSGSGDALMLRTIGRPTFPLSVRRNGVLMCQPEDGVEEVANTITLGTVGGYSGAIELTVTGVPEGVISELESDLVEVPGSTGWTLNVEPNVSLGHHVIEVTATDGVDDQHADFWLDLVAPAQPAVLVAPANGAIGVDVRPSFTWQAIEEVGTYRIQVATDDGFGDIVIDEEVLGTSFTPISNLEAVTDYFWRVQGVRGCAGTWSGTFGFTTESQPAAEISPDALEFELLVGEGESDGLSISNVGTGDLVWTIEMGHSPAAAGDPFVGRTSTWAQAATGGDRVNTGSEALALELASPLDAPLASLNPTKPTGGVIDCENEPNVVIHDDGTVENGYAISPHPEVTEMIFVERFTPGDYPASYRAVCLTFFTAGPTSLDFEIVVFDDDGPGGGPGTELGALPVFADGVAEPQEQPVWFSYNIAPLNLSIDSGSVYIGARWVPADPSVFIAADESPERPPGFAGGYFRPAFVGDDSWWPMGGQFFGEYRSLFVRAIESFPTGCDDPTTVPWLSVTPDSGVTPAGSSSPVEVMVDTTALDSGEYIANLCISTNDHSLANSLIVVPVHLTVVGSELVFNPQAVDFGDVEGGATSLPEAVVLESFGALDATGITFEILGDDGFAVDTSGCGTTLPIGGQCTVSVTFTPVALGPAEAVLEAHSDDGAIATVELAGNGVPATEAFTPLGVDVDHEPIISDANRVFEPGELVPVAPLWRNDGLFVQFLEGIASDFNGPEGPTYSLLAAEADYGEVDSGALGNCQTNGLCYEMDIGPSGVERPATHWDATFDEVLSDETAKTWTLHIGDSFTDVARSSLFYRPIETLLHSGVTGGCSDTEYCPTGPNTRAQMPVFVLKALEGANYMPPACQADASVFADLPHTNPFCPWIEELANRDVIAGCGGGNYCPNAPVTRAQMAVFLLRTLEGGGYTPPECTGVFSDVTCPSVFAAWVEELSGRGVTAGCSADPPAYCPAAPVTRQQMAVFITKTFGLELYGP